jgi:hypothetical protein
VLIRKAKYLIRGQQRFWKMTFIQGVPRIGTSGQVKRDCMQRISSSNKRERTAEISAIAIAKKDQLRERINMAFGTFTPTKVYAVAYM